MVHIKGELSTKKLTPTIRKSHYVDTVYIVDEELDVNSMAEAMTIIENRVDPKGELELVWNWYEASMDIVRNSR